ncbi:hypothetical protein L202_00940 [Cryptococcus amylolentus CBS 6039]|uniref:Uncharacterized protein n=1 Tax=Cryptococcus amylolentus CBS 6039 TaxID=1295533 RepID=A0A1E3I229_9TREE|nr:hypothetical protein L202_00940 [Cryptococcus amylolentus CBS 6039]ODN82642.1 hypothetical protein L202_00940 [Cryptococcus amylolentus CBS 6039]
MPGGALTRRTRRPAGKRAGEKSRLTKPQYVPIGSGEKPHLPTTNKPPQNGHVLPKKTRNKPLPPIPPEAKTTFQKGELWHAFKWELDRHDPYLKYIIEQMHKAPDKTSKDYLARVGGVRQLRRDVFELGESGRHALVGSRAIMRLAERTLMVIRNMYKRTLSMTPNADGTPISPPVLKFIRDLSNECKRTSLPIKVSNTMTLRRNMEKRYLDSIEKRILEMNTRLSHIVYRLQLRDKMIYQPDQWPVEAVITWRAEIQEARMGQEGPEAQRKTRKQRCVIQ